MENLQMSLLAPADRADGTSSAVGPERLSTLFRPRSVALVGATDRSNFSKVAYQNLAAFGFAERTYLVNRRGAETHGRSTVPSCSAIGEPVDVAYLMVSQAEMLNALSDAAQAGIRNAVVLSSGYAEAGPAGRAAQLALVDHARSLGMVLLGPNHLGFANFVDRTPVCSVRVTPRSPGPVALLSQSGASVGAMVKFADMTGTGLSYMITLGNEAMITAATALQYLVEDEHTRAIAIFLETIRDPQVFARAARQAARAAKPVIVLKAGRSELAARTAAAHTGAMVGDDDVISAVFTALGVVRVDSIEDLMVTAGLGAHLGPAARPGIGVVSVSGGACGILADTAAAAGAELPELGEATRTALRELLPAFATPQNPLDVTGAATIEPGLFRDAITIVSGDPGVGVMAVVNTMPWVPDGGRWHGQATANAVGEGIARSEVPVVYVNQTMQPLSDYTREVMAEARIPYLITGLRHAMVALAKISAWSQAIGQLRDEQEAARPLPAASVRGTHRGTWSEEAGRRLLAEAGIPVVPGRLVSSADDAVAACAELGGSIALKIVSAGIAHKSDVGGVRLGVTAADAGAVYQELRDLGGQLDATVDGVLATSMTTAGLELLVGVVRDPEWGLMLALGVGGVFAEVFKDFALAPLPVSSAQAARMLQSLRAAPVLAGARGGPPVDMPGLARVIERVGLLAAELGSGLAALEINPLWVRGSRVEALDVLVSWSDRE
jgi:acyl-CoA synthetase (NDP forming)